MSPERDEQRHDFWFPAKRHGWGWGPANCWQGRLVQAGYLISVITAAWILLFEGRDRLFWILFAAATIAFVAIHWWKGEKRAWRRTDG
jgi:hypothetical protein